MKRCREKISKLLTGRAFISFVINNRTNIAGNLGRPSTCLYEKNANR